MVLRCCRWQPAEVIVRCGFLVRRSLVVRAERRGLAKQTGVKCAELEVARYLELVQV